MTDLDRNHFAAAFMAVHHAAMGDRCKVIPQPQGWYLLSYDAGAVQRRCRASELLKRLAVMAGELERRAVSD